ncbi:MAG: alpha/beta hydrolase [Terracidiphilus sp.]
MTQFLDVRLQPVGGELATTISINQGTSINNYTGLLLEDFLGSIRGRNVLIASHGFNVDRADGIACLSNWESLLQLPQPSAFVGLLWPGDSIWAHGLDYPEEPKLADDAGVLIGPFVDATFGAAASVSFASHSLGARVVLNTIAQMKTPVRRLILMAGAIDDDCLSTEFQQAAQNVGEISLLSSKMDQVLSMAFPLGNFFAGILAAGHPWWRAAIGHSGPATQWPSNLRTPFEIPDGWEYEHGNYLQIDGPPVPQLSVPCDVPPNGSPEPAGGASGWQEAFSSAFVSSRFR